MIRGEKFDVFWLCLLSRGSADPYSHVVRYGIGGSRTSISNLENLNSPVYFLSYENEDLSIFLTSRAINSRNICRIYLTIIRSNKRGWEDCFPDYILISVVKTVTCPGNPWNPTNGMFKST